MMNKKMTGISIPLLAVKFGILVSSYGCYRLLYDLLPGSKGEVLAYSSGIAMCMILKKTISYLSLRIAVHERLGVDRRMVLSLLTMAAVMSGYGCLQFLAGAGIISGCLRISTLVLSVFMNLVYLSDRYAVLLKKNPDVQSDDQESFIKGEMMNNKEIIEQINVPDQLSTKDQEMLKKYETGLSRSMCFILRHHPESIGIEMNKQGWVKAEELITLYNRKHGSEKKYLSLPVLLYIVQNDEKERYGLRLDQGTLMIRCSQGHSIDWLELDYAEAEPPAVLYHGTRTAFLDSIFREGLKPVNRTHVHLSKDYDTAVSVSKRHKKQGSPVILTVNAEQMRKDGYSFFLSENNVWLCKQVPAEYLKIAD